MWWFCSSPKLSSIKPISSSLMATSQSAGSPWPLVAKRTKVYKPRALRSTYSTRPLNSLPSDIRRDTTRTIDTFNLTALTGTGPRWVIFGSPRPSQYDHHAATNWWNSKPRGQGLMRARATRLEADMCNDNITSKIPCVCLRFGSAKR